MQASTILCRAKKTLAACLVLYCARSMSMAPEKKTRSVTNCISPFSRPCANDSHSICRRCICQRGQFASKSIFAPRQWQRRVRARTRFDRRDDSAHGKCDQVEVVISLHPIQADRRRDVARACLRWRLASRRPPVCLCYGKSAVILALRCGAHRRRLRLEVARYCTVRGECT